MLDIVPQICYTVFILLYLSLGGSQMEYIKVSKAAEKWGISPRRVRILCAEGKIPGTIRKGKLYMVPADAEKPRDGRFRTPTVFEEIAEKKELLSSLHPLTPGEVERLRDEFMIEFIAGYVNERLDDYLRVLGKE